MKGFHILIVEDDSIIAKNLKKLFEQNNVKVSLDYNGDRVMRYLNEVHLIIMDVMLPGMDGIHLTDLIRQTTDIPILYLTARNDISAKLEGLRNGDDYLTKPFDPRELFLRVENLIDKYYSDKKITIGELTIDIRARTVMIDNAYVNFTKTENVIFFYFVSNINVNLTKAQIINFVWQADSVYENTLNVYIKKIRSKINDRDATVIETVYGVGYRLNSR
ncbi:DNA-binding response regulator [Staphylococcus felis]|uniref:response regulator transcription factor n=1 Tax=Staphylococcus felis TaxID=46127 RepID=UPI000E236143|nr:response regulator transcription factor [Staphylococcus felis]REH79201.1 DNA-binding response regulator [Staphylococcus felis]REH88428.1 DNA-binding response regulator [Staphylococcus felis]REH94199.1 DNA-binding response regulator [Staphylococcus felis]REI03436.1 DNA-binding response regulator [Staphylococcus felis]REI10955.1 DNA-binding response regulator [Staphylococcus felis]